MATIESPFLPDGRQWAWNSSSLGPAKECARKYYYKVKRGLVAKKAKVDLEFGGHYAKALEGYHILRAKERTHEEALVETTWNALVATWEYERTAVGARIVDSGQPWSPDHPSKTRENLIRSIIWYLDEFENDPCQTVILASGQPAVELPFRLEIGPDMWLTGHIDRLVTYASEQYVQDQKTTGSSIGAWYFKRYNPDNQMSLYTVAATVVWHTPVRGVMIDAAQIAVGFTRFERGFSFRTPDQTAEWLEDAKYHIRQTWAAEAVGWPMNDTACSKYGGCEFLDVCSKSPSVREAFLSAGFVQAFRNPLGV